VQLGMAARGIACCSKCGEIWLLGRQVTANELTLSVNGAKQVVSATAGDGLCCSCFANELKLTGPRLGCGMAQCGGRAPCCSMGKKSRACITPISYVRGQAGGPPSKVCRAVWAAEKSLSAADAAKTLHPIQQAWIDKQVPQCGYCQSGMMIAASGIARQEPQSVRCTNQGTLSRTSRRRRIFAAAAPTPPSSKPYKRAAKAMKA